MELQWRNKVKIVAYVDIILTSMVLLFVIMVAVGVGAISSDPDLVDKLNEKDMGKSEQEIAETKEILKKGVGGLWIFVIVFAIMTVIQLWAAIKLLNSTEMVTETSQALKMSNNWRIVTIVFLCLQIPGALMSASFFTLILSLIIRGGSLYVVHKFRAELEIQLNSGIPNPVMVSVK